MKNITALHKCLTLLLLLTVSSLAYAQNAVDLGRQTITFNDQTPGSGAWLLYTSPSPRD